MRLRGGRIEWKLNKFAGKIWAALYETASRRLNDDINLQDQLQSDKLWLVSETKDEGSGIEIQIKDLEKYMPDMEAEWKDCLWYNSFFRVDRPGGTLHRWLTRKQLHTFNQRESTLENRCPPNITKTESRSFEAASETLYDADPNRQKSVFAFSDISYAVRMNKGVSQKDLVIVRLLPTIRLYENALHFLEGVKIEIKPQKIEQKIDTGVYWSTLEVHQFSVRYLTLTAMTMLHEYLKLCYMSSTDANFFPEPEQLTIHIIVAAGHTIWHYIHTIGNGVTSEPIEYVSYCLGTFNMKKASERNQFRDRFNKILVLQVTNFKEAMENKIREVLALGPVEIRRRLESRAHQGVRFSHSVREDGVCGFSVEHSSPIHDMESSSKPCPSLKTIPEDSEAKLEEGNCSCENRRLPPLPPPKTRSKTATTIKVQGRKGNKDGADVTITPQVPTPEEHTYNRVETRSKRSSITPRDSAVYFAADPDGKAWYTKAGIDTNLSTCPFVWLQTGARN